MRRLAGLLAVLFALPASGAPGPLEERDLAEVIVAARHANPFVRGEAAAELGRRGGEEALVPLIRLLRDGEAEVRAVAAEALRSLGDERAVPPLSRLLEDPDPTVRCRAAVSIGDLAGRYAVPAILRLLTDREAAPRAAAVRALGELGDPTALEPILAALAAERPEADDPVGACALVAAARLGGSAGYARAKDCVAARLPGNWFLRATAAHAAGLTGDPAHVADLAATLASDADPRVAGAAAQSLATLGATETLLAGLALPEPWRRKAAAAALAGLPGPEVDSALRRAARDEDPGVVLEAAAGLLRRGEKEAFPVLVGLLAKDAPVWMGAAEVLESATGLSFGRDPARWSAWFADRRDGLVFDAGTRTWGPGR